jgi:IS5 family transposase
MRSNKLHNIDLFTQTANEHFEKHIKTQSKQALSIINAKINWDKLLLPLSKKLALEKTTDSPAGRKPHDLLIIVKCFLLQTIYNLYDPRLEEEIADRRSFQIFLGLTSNDSIPDETTICRYREVFARLGLDRILFDSFNKQLSEQKLIVGKGTIVDATLKQAQATPASNRDSDAKFTKRPGETTYGYKGHIGVDADTNVIHSVEFTPANVHDTDKFDDLLTGSERRVLADKGYADKQRKKSLQEQGINGGIMDKGYSNTQLTKKQRKRNKLLSAVRNAVERPFAFMKQVLNYQRCRYYDIARNRTQFIFCAVVFNMRRMLSLTCCIST